MWIQYSSSNQESSHQPERCCLARCLAGYLTGCLTVLLAVSLSCSLSHYVFLAGCLTVLLIRKECCTDCVCLQILTRGCLFGEDIVLNAMKSGDRRSPHVAMAFTFVQLQSLDVHELLELLEEFPAVKRSVQRATLRLNLSPSFLPSQFCPLSLSCSL